MHYIVEAPAYWFLVGTAWTGNKERAQKFDTKEQAQAALNTATRFSRPKIWRHWKIVEITD